MAAVEPPTERGTLAYCAAARASHRRAEEPAKVPPSVLTFYPPGLGAAVGSRGGDGCSGPRRRAERALFSVVAEAYLLGVSTRKVDALVRTPGIDGISKSEVSRLCAELDRGVTAFRERRLDEHRSPAGRGGRPCLHRRAAGALVQGLVDEPLERLNRELARRTDVVGIARPSSASPARSSPSSTTSG